MAAACRAATPAGASVGASRRQIAGRVPQRGWPGTRPRARRGHDAISAKRSRRGLQAVKIREVRALEILDSRGNPTVEAEIQLANGVRASAQVPSGASTGRHEALELRDGDAGRYGGKGVRRAVENVEQVLGPPVVGLDASDQAAVDRRLIEIDASEGKRRLGANAILAISCAVARAAAICAGVPLWKHLTGARTPR